MKLRRGNTYDLKVKLTEENGAPVDFSNIEKAEFIFGTCRKVFDGSGEEVTYDTADQVFIIKFTQEDTFAFKSSEIECQTRVKDVDGVVRATKIGIVDVLAVLSREVI